MAALAGDLAARGVKIGILIGTAYLFTREAVATGAIVPRFQDEALRCRGTVLLETGPGHLVRVSPTPFVDRFEAERQRLLAQGKPHEEIRETLERLNVGRLRIAAKGVDRGHGAGSPLVAVPDERPGRRAGSTCSARSRHSRDRVITMSELHQEVTAGADRTGSSGRARPSRRSAGRRPQSGRRSPSSAWRPSCPGAEDVATFWANSLRGVDAITEIPRRPLGLADSTTTPTRRPPTRSTRKWGGFLPDVPFDPLRYGMPPSSLPSIEPAQLLALEVARSGARRRRLRAIGRSRASGRPSCWAWAAARPRSPWATPSARTCRCSTRSHPGPGKAAMEACHGLLPEWTEDSFPGFLLNVTAGPDRQPARPGRRQLHGRRGLRLVAGGADLAVRELTTGAADMVVLGGVDTVQNPFTYLAFSKTQAFSPRGRCRPFDAGADGIVISEGVAAVILKRLADAERDGDRIYAVIQGVGASSDGRCRGPDRAELRGPGAGPRASVCPGRHRPGDGRLRRGPRHRHGRGRRRRDRGPDPGLPRQGGPGRRAWSARSSRRSATPSARRGSPD